MMRPHARLRALLALAALPLLAACNDSSGADRPDWSNPETIQFNAALGVNLSQMTKTSRGVYYRDLVVGTGETVRAGDRIAVRYSGWLPDATLFDNGNGQVAEFSLSQVIQGWGEGIPGMRVGGTRKLVIPPSLAYGAGGSGPIPGNATLVFDVRVEAIRGRASSTSAP